MDHPAELARLQRQALKSPDSDTPEEELALARIEELRDNELAELGDTQADRQRRHRHAIRRALTHDLTRR